MWIILYIFAEVFIYVDVLPSSSLNLHSRNMPHLSLLLTLLFVAHAAMAQNPIVNHMYTADPSARVFGNTLYVYPSHDKDDAASFSMEDYHVFYTKNMKSFRDHGVVFNPLKQTSWAKEAAWAPDCIERNGKFYLYYPTDKKHIGVAVGDSPKGPFHDPLGHPLISIDSPGVVCDRDFIDPCAFIDDDGQAYLLMGQNTVCCIKLNPDMISYDGNVHIIDIVPKPSPSASENAASASSVSANTASATSADSVTHHDFFEAVWLHKRDGIYYLSYSNGPFHGHEPEIAYATSRNILGPYDYQGIILGPVNSGTNHHSIVEYKKQWYLFYHTADLSRYRDSMRTPEEKLAEPNFHCGVRRSMCVDKLYYNADGTIKPVVPTISKKQLK